MFNPFEEEEIIKQDFEDESILIVVDRRGRKQNTYISGWNKEVQELKTHLKNLKKNLACNGSVKEHLIDGENKIVIRIQGNHLVKIKEYLIDNGVTESNISVRE